MNESQKKQVPLRLSPKLYDAIARVGTNAKDKPRTDVVIESIRFVTVPEKPVGSN